MFRMNVQPAPGAVGRRRKPAGRSEKSALHRPRGRSTQSRPTKIIPNCTTAVTAIALCPPKSV
jgi:hypothetical protein